MHPDENWFIFWSYITSLPFPVLPAVDEQISWKGSWIPLSLAKASIAQTQSSPRNKTEAWKQKELVEHLPRFLHKLECSPVYYDKMQIMSNISLNNQTNDKYNKEVISHVSRGFSCIWNIPVRRKKHTSELYYSQKFCLKNGLLPVYSLHRSRVSEGVGFNTPKLYFSCRTAYQSNFIKWMVYCGTVNTFQAILCLPVINKVWSDQLAPVWATRKATGAHIVKTEYVQDSALPRVWYWGLIQC